MDGLSRVTADIYRGVELSADWVTHPAEITSGNARELIFSVVALLDPQDRPLALCWQVGGAGEDHFVRSRFDDGSDVDLDTAMTRDLVIQSERVGVPDLLATLLWAPVELRREQGTLLERGYRRATPYQLNTFNGWNVAPQVIAARSADILVVVRSCELSLRMALPVSAEQLRAGLVQDGADTLVVLPFQASDALAPAKIQPLQVLLIAVVALLAMAAVAAVVAGK